MIAVTSSLPNLNDLSHAQKDELIVALFDQHQSLMAQQAVLMQRITELEGRLRLNSRNSSKPPSSDALSKPAPKSLRPSGERPNGYALRCIPPARNQRQGEQSKTSH